jgi:hypothetical protein
VFGATHCPRGRAHSLCLTIVGALCGLPALLSAQNPPRDSARIADSTKRAGAIVIPGLDLPIQVDLRIATKAERDRNLRCNSLEAFQVSSLSGCGGGFLGPSPDFKFSLKSAGDIGDRLHVNVDYDAQREFDASNNITLAYQGRPGATLRRVDVGNITFTPPQSRFLTASLPSGNYGAQATFQIGRLSIKPIFAIQTGNIVQDRQFTLGHIAEQRSERDIDDYQIEPRRFFFTVNPSLFGSAYPNIDILDRAQLDRLRARLPETVRPTRVLVYRLQFGTQPQNPSGPQFRLQSDGPGGSRQTYDLLREGVDYFMDKSLLWFALVRPLNSANERLVVAYNVRVNGRDSVIASTGGTPDLQVDRTHDQVANLVTDPGVGPSSPAFRNEIRSVYRLAGQDLIRKSAQVRIVTGGGLLEHPLAGGDATFLQMFGLSQSMNPAEFDYNNRIWPRPSDAVLDLGAGAPDVRTPGSLGSTDVIRDHFIVFPSLQPFSPRDSGLVTAGNPTNSAIYTTPGDYLYSTQHPTSVYRIHVQYQTSATDEPGVVTLGATQMRPGSERIIVGGRTLVKDLDYHIDYDLGRIDFVRPDTLFPTERVVSVRYEDNATAFISSQTSLGGVVAELPLSHGVVDFSAVRQAQSSPFTRPQLGFQDNSMLTAGMTGQFSWETPALSRWASKLPSSDGRTASHFSLQGEVATSRPQFGSQGQAYVTDFEGSGGLSIALGDAAWHYSSLPAYGHTLRSLVDGGSLFELNRASTLVWQTFVKPLGGTQIKFTRSSIDPLLVLSGAAVEPNEPVMWLTLLPLDQRGRFNRATKSYDWTVANQPSGRRFRSIQTVLAPAGTDLSGDELLEFWTLVDTSVTARAKNPTLIFDFGDISENAIGFAPETLMVKPGSGGLVDSLFTGKKLQGFDTLDTERDPFSHTFNAAVNDNGLPGDVVDTLVVVNGSTVTRVAKAKICRGAIGSLDVLGDPHTNCTIGNSRLDEEDIDLDNALNFTNAQRESERLLRYVVDLSDPAKYKRVGGRYTDTLLVSGVPEVRTRQWVLVSIPFNSPTDSLNDVNRRRIRALRLSVVSGVAQDNEEATQFPIAELHVTGAPWLDRSNNVLVGLGGVQLVPGTFVLASSIGTTDSSAKVVYQPPPSVNNQADTKGQQFTGGLTSINEHSMRIQAGNMPVYDRAETYYRFPAGPQNFFGFQELRVWGRGHGDGWGQTGDLQMYLKVGRDENNFYMYRSPLNAGQTAAAWTDLVIDFQRFVALRKKVQTDYLAGKKESIACTGVDSAMIAATPLPVGIVSHRFAACDDGYMVYTVDPAVSAPNLTAVQEVAVGILRVAATGGAGGSGPIVPGDTLDLWVDDVRLSRPTNTVGIAGQVGASINFGDFADVRMSVSNKDPNFRQLGEQAQFLGERDIDMSAVVRLDKLLPATTGVSLPLTITKLSYGNDPLYLTQTDISSAGIPGVRKPRNDVTTYSLTARKTIPSSMGIIAPLINNLSATTSYVTGVDRTEYQDGNARNFTATVDYLVVSDSARAVGLPPWIDRLLGGLPGVLQAGPVTVLRATPFRWNPSQLRLTTGFVNANDRRVSFIKPAGAPDDPPSSSLAQSKLWRNGGTLEFHPTSGLMTRWEMQSVRDLRDYGDSTTIGSVATRQQGTVLGANAGFERERTMFSSISFAPAFSAWFHPRAELGTQYEMLRDPNVRSLLVLPGVVGVDSVLAAHDSLAQASSFVLPRRMTSAQTLYSSASVDLAKLLSMYAGDSSTARRVGAFFAPVDVSYTRNLLSTLDAAPVGAPLLYQLGLGGAGSFRRVNGIDATAAGRTGTLVASTALLLPRGTSITNKYSHINTLNWIGRPDTTQAEVNGSQTRFPDAAVRWRYQPTAVTGAVTTLDASIGYARSDVTTSLPSLFTDAAPEIRHTHIETFPIGGSVAWTVPGGLSTGARYSLVRRIDSLPGSVARSHGDEISVDAGHAFKVPERWGLGLKSSLRTRASFQQTRSTTYAYDATGSFQSRLQDNGRQTVNLTADTNVQDNAVLTFQGSRITNFDNNINRKFEQLVLSMALQIQFFGAGK